MPNKISSTNPLSRFLKSDPHRDFFRVLADSLSDSVLIFSSDCQQLLTVNHSFLLLSGYSRAELELVSPRELFPGDAGNLILGKIQDCLNGPECRLHEASLKTRQGSITLIDLEARPITPSNTGILITARLSSTRIQSKELRSAQEEQLSLLVGIAEDLANREESSLSNALTIAKRLLIASLIGLYRVSSSEPVYIRHGTLSEEFPTQLDMAHLESLQYSSAWSLGQRPEHPLQKAARACGLQALRTAPIGTDTAWVGVLLAGWRDPNEIPEHADSLLNMVAELCHASILMDLETSESLKLQLQIAQLEADFLDQSTVVTDGLLFLDSQLRVRRANPSAAKLLGYHEEELAGLPIQDVLVGPKDILATILDAQGHQREADLPRFTIHRSDGVPFPVHLRVFPRSRGENTELLIVLNDQSEKQAIENQNEALAQRALLGEVAAIFAHEVRNPINNISTGIQLAASRLGEQHPLHQSLERIRSECTRLDQLLSDVLFFARPLELKIEPLNLEDMLTRLIQRWKPRLQQSNVHCHSAFDPSTPLASADPRTLEQVIVNIITNALQAMNEGGTLSFSLAPIQMPQGDMVEIKIADTGPGIPADIIDRVFNPFFTTKKDGTGLGLAISRRILSAHKGHIQVESFPGAGTVFSIHIPACKLENQE